MICPGYWEGNVLGYTFRERLPRVRRGMKRNRRMRREGRAKSRRAERQLFIVDVDHAEQTITLSSRRSA